MSLNENLLEGFSKLTRQERFERLLQLGALTQEDIFYLNNGGIKDINLADKLIENVIGYFQLPLGVATNFCIDNKDYIIPMAVEETSIIAALSKTAKWIKYHGEITTGIVGNCIIGQIQISKVKNLEKLTRVFKANKIFLIEKVNEEVASSMVRRGGGVKDMQLRTLKRPDNGYMAIIHLTMNSKDAMGANLINQVLEYLKLPLENLTDEKVSMCILSNLNDEKITSAKVTIRNVERDLGIALQEASLFAEIDPYRATTHNKGVMNGIDPLLIATGNDWRAVEAGVHAYASRFGKYESITKWRYNEEEKILVGQFEAPVIVGIVGGVTSLHPTAKMCLRMLKIKSADQLSRIIAAVGLVQNLGALRALCTEGIIQGHMKLHIDNLLLASKAKEDEIPVLKIRLENWLYQNRRVSLQNAFEILSKIREDKLVS